MLKIKICKEINNIPNKCSVSAHSNYSNGKSHFKQTFVAKSYFLQKNN